MTFDSKLSCLGMTLEIRGYNQKKYLPFISTDGNNRVKINSVPNGVTFFINRNLINSCFHCYNAVTVTIKCGPLLE